MQERIILSEQLSAQVDRALDLLQRWVEAVERGSRPETQVKQGAFMFIVQDSQPDVKFTLTAPVVEDARGNPITPQPALTAAVVSDAPDVGAVTFDPTTLSGSVAFPGKEGTANINATFTDDADKLVGSFGAQFTVTAGPATQIVGGSIMFEGLTEAP
jgi:hypothetical protein